MLAENRWGAIEFHVLIAEVPERPRLLKHAPRLVAVRGHKPDGEMVGVVEEWPALILQHGHCGYACSEQRGEELTS